MKNYEKESLFKNFLVFFSLLEILLVLLFILPHFLTRFYLYLLSLIFATGLPVLVQQFVVKPNELAKESPYIAHNIDFTRRAYNLNNIKEVDFEVNNNLSADEIKNHEVTIQNIRVWDERPLLQTYRQIQSIRLYYDFNNVDVDRYRIDNQYRQVMLAARELVVEVDIREKSESIGEVFITYKKGEALNQMTSVSSISFNVEETKRYPVSVSDPARMVQVFAGVSGTPGLTPGPRTTRQNTLSTCSIRRGLSTLKGCWQGVARC